MLTIVDMYEDLLSSLVATVNRRAKVTRSGNVVNLCNKMSIINVFLLAEFS